MSAPTVLLNDIEPDAAVGAAEGAASEMGTAAADAKTAHEGEPSAEGDRRESEERRRSTMANWGEM